MKERYVFNCISFFVIIYVIQLICLKILFNQGGLKVKYKINIDIPELDLELQDDEWNKEYIDHNRQIVRAIVVDDLNYFYFVRVHRDDDFGKATLIETAGGGVELNENLESAIRRELKEELGVEVEIICKIGVVSDYYNLIHRHNINNYYFCKIESFGDRNLTIEEIESFKLSTLKLTFEDAIKEYKKCSNTKLGKLILNREIPVLNYVKEILNIYKCFD